MLRDKRGGNVSTLEFEDLLLLPSMNCRDRVWLARIASSDGERHVRRPVKSLVYLR